MTTMNNQLTTEHEAALLTSLQDFFLPTIISVTKLGLDGTLPLAVTFSASDFSGDATFYINQEAFLNHCEVVMISETDLALPNSPHPVGETAKQTEDNALPLLAFKFHRIAMRIAEIGFILQRNKLDELAMQLFRDAHTIESVSAELATSPTARQILLNSANKLAKLYGESPQ
jgi:hypothetical protein